jgi:hypothetical protein
MKTIIAACVATLIVAGTTFAEPRSTGRSTSSTTASSHRDTKNLGSSRDYHRTHGRSFSHGYFYEGRQHSHWTNYRWSSRFGCYTYFCPSTSCYYYWSEPTQCFYPVSYAETVVPTRSEQRLNISVNNSNNNNNSNAVTSGVPMP